MKFKINWITKGKEGLSAKEKRRGFCGVGVGSFFNTLSFSWRARETNIKRGAKILEGSQ